MEKVDILKRLASVPKEERVSSFFRDLGIGFFIEGCTVGMYDIDWGYITLEKLDEKVISDTYPEGFHLRRTTNGVCGSIENPKIQKGDVEFVFTFATFMYKKFWLKIQKIQKGKVENGEYSVAYLRRMLR